MKSTPDDVLSSVAHSCPNTGTEFNLHKALYEYSTCKLVIHNQRQITFPDSILANMASGESSPVEANGVLPANIMYNKTPRRKSMFLHENYYDGIF